MRNLKKLVTILLTVAVFASMFAVPALAEETADALTLETLGVLKGTGNGVDAAYRASTPTRYQAAWLFLRLLGKEDEAKVWQGTLNFSDVDTAENAEGHKLNDENKKMLGYLYAHQNLGFRGYADDTFRPFVDVDAQMYYKLMLVALGYVEGTDFTWDTVFAKAIEVGLIAEAPAAGAAFTIDSIADATVAALGTTYKGTTDSLIKKLVEVDKALDADKAAASGLYEAPVVVLTVTDVKASDMGEIFVTFNSEVDAAKLAGNFTVDGNAATAKLSADGKVATVVVPTPKANGQSYALVVKKAIGLEADYTASITVFDTAKPTVVDVKLTGPNTFDITFSEILAAVNGTVRVNNGMYGISNAVRDGKVVTVTLASTTLPNGEYDIEVSGYVDLAGFAMDKVVKTLTYAKDATKPTASVVRTSQTEIVIRFDEPVTLNATLTNYYHTFEHYVVSAAPTLVAGTEADYAFSFAAGDFPLPAGNTTFYIKKDAVADKWGNKMDATSLPITVDTDTESPYVVSAVYEAGKLVVTFSEPVNATDAVTKSYFDVKLGTKAATINTITYDADKLTTTITFTAPLEGGKWSVVVTKVKDLALVGNVVEENLNFFTLEDEIPIDTTKVSATIVIGPADGNDIIYLTYPEAMNETALNVSYYMLKTGATTTALNAKTVKIEATSATSYKITRAHDATLVPGTSFLVIGRVQDAVGNAPAAFSFDVLLPAEAAPAVVAVAQTAANKLAVTFNKELTDYTLEAFRFSVDGVVYHTPAMFESVVKKEGNTTLTFLLTADLIEAIKGVSADYATNTAEIIGAGDLAGITLELIADKVVSITGMKNAGAMIQALNTDKRAPVFVRAEERTVGSNYGVALIFSEPITSVNPAYFANDIIMTSGTTTLLAGEGFTTGWDAGAVMVYGAGTLKSVEAPALIKDAAGNKAGAFGQGAANSADAPITLRTVYNSSLDPIVNGTYYSGVGPKEIDTYLLPTAMTGDFSVEFDMVNLTGKTTQAYIAFMSAEILPYYHKDTDAHYLSHMSAYVYNENGLFAARNGGGAYSDAALPESVVEAGKVYHIRVEFHLVPAPGLGTYEVFITPEGGAEVQLGPEVVGGFLFRNNGGLYTGATREMVTSPQAIAAVCISGEAEEVITISNIVCTQH